jgi:hypothetical protein
MKPKLILCLALVLSGGLLGCSSGKTLFQSTNHSSNYADTNFTSLVTGAQGLASNDGPVIDAALKTIFEKTDWNTRWTNGDFVVVMVGRADWYKPPRSSLSRCLDEFIGTFENGYEHGAWINSSNQLEVLREIRKSAGPDSDLDSLPMADPKDMKLDPRIVVSNVEFGESFRSGETSIINRIGKHGRVIAPVLLTPPGYSRTGRYAVLETHWYKNAADAVFFLENKDGHWRVISVVAFGYI